MQTVDSLESLIKEQPFLAGLEPRLLGFFCECATIRRFASRQQIFQEHGEADHFYLIISGSVDLETFVPGCGMVTVQTLRAGEVLGWSWLFEPREWHFTATTREPSDVISFDAAQLRAKAEEDREFRDQLLVRITKTLVQRLYATRMQLVDIYQMRP